MASEKWLLEAKPFYEREEGGICIPERLMPTAAPSIASYLLHVFIHQGSNATHTLYDCMSNMPTYITTSWPAFRSFRPEIGKCQSLLRRPRRRAYTSTRNARFLHLTTTIFFLPPLLISSVLVRLSGAFAVIQTTHLVLPSSFLRLRVLLFPHNLGKPSLAQIILVPPLGPAPSHPLLS